jgi:hypothetical protein
VEPRTGLGTLENRISKGSFIVNIGIPLTDIGLFNIMALQSLRYASILPGGFCLCMDVGENERKVVSESERERI